MPSKKIFVLVGPPSVGKSTWISNTFEETPYIINRDDIVNQVASSLGWSYDDMFMLPPSDAEIGDIDEKYGEVVKSPPFIKWSDKSFSKVLDANNQVHKNFMQRVSQAVPSGKDIVVDMTNMSANSRRSALRAIQGAEEEYEKIAVVFEFKGFEDIIKSVAKKRAELAKKMGKSKTIPESVMNNMMKSFERPTKDEGFDRVISVDNSKILKELANEENDMSEMKFSNKNEALQCLADLTGKRIKIAAIIDFKIKDKSCDIKGKTLYFVFESVEVKTDNLYTYDIQPEAEDFIHNVESHIIRVKNEIDPIINVLTSSQRKPNSDNVELIASSKNRVIFRTRVNMIFSRNYTEEELEDVNEILEDLGYI